MQYSNNKFFFSVRQKLIFLHVVLSSFFLPMILMFLLTGVLATIGYQSSSKKVSIAKVYDSTLNEEEVEQFFIMHGYEKPLKVRITKHTDGSILSIKGRGKNYKFILESLDITTNLITFQISKLNLYDRLMIGHKGQGTLVIKVFTILAVIAFTVTFMTGVFMSYTIPKLKRAVILYISLGFITSVFLYSTYL